MTAALRTATVPLVRDASHVFADGCWLDGRATRLAALIDPMFLVEAGWDEAAQVLSPPPEHRLLGRPLCQPLVRQT